jgi:hypothetical protein
LPNNGQGGKEKTMNTFPFSLSLSGILASTYRNIIYNTRARLGEKQLLELFFGAKVIRTAATTGGEGEGLIYFLMVFHICVFISMILFRGIISRREKRRPAAQLFSQLKDAVCAVVYSITYCARSGVVCFNILFCLNISMCPFN